jgi:hypothetical protein
MLSSEKITEMLFDECQEVGKKVSGLVELDERLVTVGATLIIGAATVAVAKGKEDILLGVPLAISALLSFIAYLHGELFALGGYKAALEEELARRVGRPIIVWESHVSVPLRHRSQATITALMFLVLLYGAGSFAAVIEAHRAADVAGWRQAHGALLVVLTWASIFVGALASGFALTSARLGYKRARMIASAALNARPPSSATKIGSEGLLPS